MSFNICRGTLGSLALVGGKDIVADDVVLNEDYA
jgi:hypothetical protein